MRDIDYMDRRTSSGEFEGLYTYLAALKGAAYWGYYNSLKPGCINGQVALKIKHNDKDVEIGHYVPDRNVVLFYIPIYYDWDSGMDNKFVLQILKYVKEIADKYKFKSVDVSNIKQRMLMEKFAKGTDIKIRSVTDNINENQRNIDINNPKIVSWHKGILEMSVEKRSLEQYRENLLNGMDSVLEEVTKLKFVEDIKFGEEGILVKFPTVYIKVKNEDILMGNYTVTIKPDRIDIKNDQPIERQGNIYHHPHISNRSVCFGEQSTMVNKLLASLEIKKLTHFLWTYLNTFNQGDTFIPMSDWINGRKNDGVVVERHYCDYCSSRYDDDDWDEDRDMCINCADNHSWCDRCESEIHYDDYDVGLDMCHNCRDEDYSYCNECNEWIKKDDYDNSLDMCEECRDENHKFCHKCAQWVENNDMSKDDSFELCNNCYDSREEERRINGQRN